VNQCDHIGILTNNADALLRFYTEKLDFTKQTEEILSGKVFGEIFGFAVDCRFIRLSASYFIIELFEPIPAKAHPRAKETAGLNHFGYCVKNRCDYVSRLHERGVPVIEVKRNSHTVYFVSDPDGNRIEIRECIT
jgi:catechol 2,3-dioxygenase-like lactoylglutathione lyase family enzyme